MIFVTAGTTRSDFKRLFVAVDQLAAEKTLCHVQAQIGHTTYEPGHCRYQRFHTRDEMATYIRDSEFVISHGGAATLEECLGQGKRTIVVPRLAACGEVVDDHQLHFAMHLARKRKILLVLDIRQLRDRVIEMKHWQPKPTAQPNPALIVETINAFIDGSPRPGNRIQPAT